MINKSISSKKIIKLFLFVSIILLIGLLLVYPEICVKMAFYGLNLWFQKMIPTLFPFMVLSGILVQTGWSRLIGKSLYPVVGRIFQIHPQASYAILIGFLCGFPMGAYIVSLLYQKEELTKQEASYLLCFCNNLGPVFLLSYVLPIVNDSMTDRSFFTAVLPYLLLFYGVPLLYGLLLRYTVYRQLYSSKTVPDKNRMTIRSTTSNKAASSVSFLEALDYSLENSLHNVTKLGGYMILFNLLAAIPVILHFPVLCQDLLHCFFEITGGIAGCQSSPLLYLLLYPFGGLSCLAQTYSVLRPTGLSFSKYVVHRCILTVITCVFCVFFWQL